MSKALSAQSCTKKDLKLKTFEEKRTLFQTFIPDLLLKVGNLQKIQNKYFKAIKRNLLLIINFRSDICSSSQKLSMNESQ